MKLENTFKKLAIGAAVSVALVGGAFANTGGGATIHNAATLTYNSGQQVTDWINVSVLTIGTAPTIALTSVTPQTVNAGDTITFNYNITSNANGSDSYTLATTSSTATGLTPGTSYSLSTGAVALGASVTTAATVSVDVDTGTVFIPAGSQTNLAPGDTVVMNGGTYTVDAVRPGTIAVTVGHTTTPETYTQVDLTAVGASPVIGNATVPVGTQLGERTTATVTVTVTTPTTVGTNGTVNVAINGSTGALDTSGSPVSYDTSTDGSGTNDASITVLSATVSILKEARNITKGTAFGTVGLNAQSGDVLEYRVTMFATTGNGNATGSVLVDELPNYTTYNTGTTTLNGTAVTDDVGISTPFPLDSVATTGQPTDDGMAVNSATGASGVIVDSESAVVIYRVTVQ